MTHLQGGSFWQGAASGALSSGIGSGNQALGGGTVELIFESAVGLRAVISGGNFWSGFGTGLSLGVFNHALHSITLNSYEEGLKEYFALVVGESSDNVDEAAGIGDVILKRLEHVGAELKKGFVSKIRGAGQFDAIGGKDYNAIMKMDLKSIMSIKSNQAYYNRIQGAEMAFWCRSCNYSNGGYFFNRSKDQYLKIKGFNWNAYNNGTFTITTTLGQSTFFTYSNSNKKWP
jgi:hypothetical protein